jgi:oligopeptide/dipeptide ABC transporter ATP-binding protein
MSAAPLLRVHELRKHFPVTEGVIRRRQVGAVKAVDGVSFDVDQGSTTSLVGESGCGKSTTAKCVLMIERPTVGSIALAGKDVTTLEGDDRRAFRASVQAVFQDPFSSLNPRMRVLDIVGEPLVVHRGSKGKALEERVVALLEKVGLGARAVRAYPHEFSGGQRQRIAIARALALDPALIVLDEPVSGLDVSVRAQVTNLLQDLQQQLGLAYLLIAHDLAMVQHMSDTIGVMYLGQLVERASKPALRAHRLHPYTQALFAAAQPVDPGAAQDAIVLGGEVPSPLDPPSGCRFHPRCPHAMPRCSEVAPALREVAPAHYVACHLYTDVAPVPLSAPASPEAIS